MTKSERATPAEPRTRHLVPLPAPDGLDEAFGVWPWASIRGAGFPARAVEVMVAPETAAAIDRMIADGSDDRAPVKAVYAHESQLITERLRALAQDPRFREAVTWQNRHALTPGLDSFVRATRVGPAKERERVRLVGSYLQRYCAKNDTIGFFGPVCWARVTSNPEALTARPGATLLASRSVYFENWCIDIIADRLARDPALEPVLVARLWPYVRVQGNQFHIPGRAPLEFPATQAAVLAQADGTRSARELARALVGRTDLDLPDEEAVYRILRHARDQGVIAWDFNLTLQLYPEKPLRMALAAIDDPEVRARTLGPLDELLQARDRVASSAGDDRALDQAIAALEQTFERITGEAPTRASGRTYAARTLVYEDTRRAFDAEFGAPFMARLGPPMSTLLYSARWLTHQVANAYRQKLLDIHERLSAATGNEVVELAHFHKVFFESEPNIARQYGNSSIVDAARDGLQRRWGEILAIPEGAREMRYRVADILPQVRAAFAAPDVGWHTARYASPDVLIAAPSVEAVRRGDYQLVLGEMHIASTTLASSIFLSQHPAPEEMVELLRSDDPRPIVMPVQPDRRTWNQRTSHVLVKPEDYRYLFGEVPSPTGPETTLRVADMVTVRRNGQVFAERRDGSQSWDMIEFIGIVLGMLCSHGFDVLPDMRHTPRVFLDDLIIARESWTFTAKELAFATAADPLERWIGARRWRTLNNLPRRVFVGSGVERKPYYVDFDSPVLVGILVRLIHRTHESGADETVTFSEMLPDMEQLWLADSAGERYTSELRLVVFDHSGRDRVS